MFPGIVQNNGEDENVEFVSLKVCIKAKLQPKSFEWSGEMYKELSRFYFFL